MSLHWLERLTRATEYRDLHVLFSEMSADAQSTIIDNELPRQIDQAIGRIRQESLHDESDLQKAEDAYQTFREQQSGLLGWLRRHLPFTATRRKEKQHKQALADQQAELLANQLVIARAQMIKEQLLPPETRRLGYRIQEWQRRFSEADSRNSLQKTASLARELREEINRSKTFVQDLDSNLNSFSSARFTDSEDRQRKDADLTAARNEWSVLQTEIQQEESLRTKVILGLGKIISEQLSSNDPQYRELEHRIDLLGTASKRAKQAHESFEEILSEIKPMRDAADELESIPTQLDELARQSRRIERELVDADRQRDDASNIHADSANKHDRAKDNVERAQAGVEAAKAVYEAYLMETGQVEMPIDDSSPVATAYRRKQEELANLQDALRSASGPYKSSKAEFTRAQANADSLASKREDLKQQRELLARRNTELHVSLDNAQDRINRLNDRADKNASSYLESIRPLNRHELLREFDRVIPDRRRELTRHTPDSIRQRELKKSEELYSLAMDHFDEVRRTLDRNSTDDQALRHSIWQHRCAELLGDDISSEICPVD